MTGYQLEEVPEGKELLWYLDQHLTYDLLGFLYQASFNKHRYSNASRNDVGIGFEAILIQRYTKWNYPFAKNYSQHLYDALQNHLAPTEQETRLGFPRASAENLAKRNQRDYFLTPNNQDKITINTKPKRIGETVKITALIKGENDLDFIYQLSQQEPEIKQQLGIIRDSENDPYQNPNKDSTYQQASSKYFATNIVSNLFLDTRIDESLVINKIIFEVKIKDQKYDITTQQLFDSFGYNICPYSLVCEDKIVEFDEILDYEKISISNLRQALNLFEIPDFELEYNEFKKEFGVPSSEAIKLKNINLPLAQGSEIIFAQPKDDDQYVIDNDIPEDQKTDNYISHPIFLVKNLNYDIYNKQELNIIDFNEIEHESGNPTISQNIRDQMNGIFTTFFTPADRDMFPFYQYYARRFSYSIESNVTVLFQTNTTSATDILVSFSFSNGIGFLYDTSNVSELEDKLKQEYDFLYTDREYFWSQIVTDITIVEMISAIYHTLGAGEFATYEDDTGKQIPYYMHLARKLDWLCKALGLSFNADGSTMSVRRQRVKVPVKSDGTYTIPDGYALGQVIDNEGGNQDPALGMTGGLEGEERTGFVYKRRGRSIINYDPDNPENNVYAQGEVILCENILQYLESMLEDFDTCLGMADASAGIMISADKSSSCQFQGLSTLVAENSYMNSFLTLQVQLLQNNLTQTLNNTQQLFKALGVQTANKTLEIPTGTTDISGDEQKVYQNLAYVRDVTKNISDRLADLEKNIAELKGAST